MSHRNNLTSLTTYTLDANNMFIPNKKPANMNVSLLALKTSYYGPILKYDLHVAYLFIYN